VDIKITLIDKTEQQGKTNVVIFRKNVADPDAPVVAWKIIETDARRRIHPFTITQRFFVAAQDSWGNVSDLQIAENGQKWNVVRSTSGDVLSLDYQPAASPNEIEIKNALVVGAVSAQIYSDGRLLATKNGLAPQQKAVFGFKPSIWVGVVSQIEEGDIMNSAILAAINTEISLAGITQADLVMTGGGPGPGSQPFEFTPVPTT